MPSLEGVRRAGHADRKKACRICDGDAATAPRWGASVFPWEGSDESLGREARLKPAPEGLHGLSDATD